MEDLYLGDGFVHNPKQDLVEFIFYFLTNYNLNYNTLSVENGNVQCYNDRHRSLGDIYAVCKHYYPSCTMEEVKEILLDFGNLLKGHFCSGIMKRVYVLHIPMYMQGSKEKNDEFGNVITYKSTNKHKTTHPHLF